MDRLKIVFADLFQDQYQWKRILRTSEELFKNSHLSLERGPGGGLAVKPYDSLRSMLADAPARAPVCLVVNLGHHGELRECGPTIAGWSPRPLCYLHRSNERNWSLGGGPGLEKAGCEVQYYGTDPNQSAEDFAVFAALLASLGLTSVPIGTLLHALNRYFAFFRLEAKLTLELPIDDRQQLVAAYLDQIDAEMKATGQIRHDVLTSLQEEFSRIRSEMAADGSLNELAKEGRSLVHELSTMFETRDGDLRELAGHLDKWFNDVSHTMGDV